MNRLEAAFLTLNVLSPHIKKTFYIIIISFVICVPGVLVYLRPRVWLTQAQYQVGYTPACLRRHFPRVWPEQYQDVIMRRFILGRFGDEKWLHEYTWPGRKSIGITYFSHGSSLDVPRKLHFETLRGTNNISKYLVFRLSSSSLIKYISFFPLITVQKKK